MRILKWVFLLLLALVALIALFAAFNWDKVARLNAVNTLFSEEKIVDNFSNMNAAFLTADIPSNGVVVPWEINEKPLPEAFTSLGVERDVKAWLEESQTTSLLVIHNGKIAHESYYKGTRPEDVRIGWSVSKSFLSAVFGTAVAEGVIELDEKVETYVPEFANSAYKDVTVRNVLNMASGVKFNEDYLDFWSDINKMGRLLAIGGSMDDFALSIEESERKPGVARQYVSIDTHVLAMVLREATGKSLIDLVSERLVSQLGFEYQPFYITDSYGNAFALGGINVATRDYARFGQMILQNGKWNNKQVVPAGWVVSSTIKSSPPALEADGFGYGYQWWIPDGSIENGGDFEARGIYGQYLYINPKTKTVIVRTAANRKFREEIVERRQEKHVYVDLFREISKSMSAN